ncbi:hypothetical protein [Streptomyces decoyicus]
MTTEIEPAVVVDRSECKREAKRGAEQDAPEAAGPDYESAVPAAREHVAR